MESNRHQGHGQASPCFAVATPMPRHRVSALRRSARHRATLALLLLIGLITVAYYFSWWFEDARIDSAPHALAFVAAALYQGMQLFLCWFLYWKAEGRRAPPIPPAASPEPLVPIPEVDVFVPVYREPYHVVEAALRAARDMKLPHRTVLLDDDRDPEMRALAAQLGVGYRVRSSNEDAKAGNVNAALADSTAEIVAIFDVDHRPKPDFLAKTLGYFRDPGLGFVQVMLTFDNEQESWVARAAAESTIEFFNPTCLGMDAVGSTTLIGSNALIRTEALRQIGGYRPGLAEDLATSVALHAAGWKSVYVHEPLAPGLAPSDLASWFAQQLKWSRGVFEVVLVDYPRLWRRLTAAARACYVVRGSYYLIGILVAVHLWLTTAAILLGQWSGDADFASYDFASYIEHALPLLAAILLIRQTVMRHVAYPGTPTRPLWRPVLLVAATWPVYLAGLVLTLLRVPIRYRPTPKARGRAVRIAWVLPQLAAVVLLVAGIALAGPTVSPWLLFFAFVQLVSQACVPVIAAAERLAGAGAEPPQKAELDGKRVSEPIARPGVAS
jgi:cellulose synthase (UDP-forming)